MGPRCLQQSARRTIGTTHLNTEAAMRATAAVLYEVKKPVVVEDVEVLEPGP